MKDESHFTQKLMVNSLFFYYELLMYCLSHRKFSLHVVVKGNEENLFKLGCISMYECTCVVSLKIFSLKIITTAKNCEDFSLIL